ncbi:hypothetical protein JCM8115_003532 [Rhodotorula mucilaginosa]
MTGTSTQTEPIRIPDSQSGEAFSLSSGTSFLSPSIALDGPLHHLLPSLSLDENTRGETDSRHAEEGALAEVAKQRRRLSGLSAYLSSPPRSSPLSRSVLEDDSDDSDGFASGASRWRARRRLSYSFGSPPGPAEMAPADPWVSRSHRRQSSITSASFKSGSLTTSSPFIGSFEDSLLQGRMSTPPSASFDFVASIGVLGSSDLPMHRRCPPHLHVGFSAVFYASPGDPRSSPYVGTIDLYQHYLRLLDPPGVAAELPMPSAKLPRFPGYPVPERGQVQIVLKDSNETAFRPFLVPYDLTGLDRQGAGGRTFVRQKSYSVEQLDRKGRLRFAVHLQFCSPPERKRSRRSEAVRTPRYYLYHTIRVVFASRGSEPSDEWRIVRETPDSGATAINVDGSARFSPYPGPPDEWTMARKKAKERLKASAMARLEASTSTIEPPRLDLPSSPPVTATTLSHVSIAPPVVVSTTGPSLLPTFSFDRVPSPTPNQRGGVSALSALRPVESHAAPALPPTSHAHAPHGGERERCGR